MLMNKNKIKITLPHGISVNHAYFFKGGKRIKTKKARDFENEVYAIVEKIVKKQGEFKPKQKIICEMIFYFPDNIRRDTHNQIKLLLDAIEKAGLYKDDRYVLPHILDWQIDKENPRIECTFYYKE